MRPVCHSLRTLIHTVATVVKIMSACQCDHCDGKYSHTRHIPSGSATSWQGRESVTRNVFPGRGCFLLFLPPLCFFSLHSFPTPLFFLPPRNGLSDPAKGFGGALLAPPVARTTFALTMTRSLYIFDGLFLNFLLYQSYQYTNKGIKKTPGKNRKKFKQVHNKRQGCTACYRVVAY